MSKYKKLLLSLALDLIGMITTFWILPLIGDIGDVVWAPISALIMMKLYKGNSGKVAGVVSFVEEIIPGFGTDFIPSFTLMWLYTYVVKSKQVQDIIDVD